MMIILNGVKSIHLNGGHYVSRGLIEVSNNSEIMNNTIKWGHIMAHYVGRG